MMDKPESPRETDLRDRLRKFLHDLATPLSAVSLHLARAARQARRGDDPSEALAIAGVELERAFSLFESGREELLSNNRAEAEESFLFDEMVLATIRPNGAGRTRLEGSTGGRVRGDRRSISEALSTLVGNVMQVSDGPSLRVAVERFGDRLRVRLESPGRLPEGNSEKFFSFRTGLARAKLQAASAGAVIQVSESGGNVSTLLELPEDRS